MKYTDNSILSKVESYDVGHFIDYYYDGNFIGSIYKDDPNKLSEEEQLEKKAAHWWTEANRATSIANAWVEIKKMRIK